jgi:ELWxxDGT repeat protein
MGLRCLAMFIMHRAVSLHLRTNDGDHVLPVGIIAASISILDGAAVVARDRLDYAARLANDPVRVGGERSARSGRAETGCAMRDPFMGSVRSSSSRIGWRAGVLVAGVMTTMAMGMVAPVGALAAVPARQTAAIPPGCATAKGFDDAGPAATSAPSTAAQMSISVAQAPAQPADAPVAHMVRDIDTSGSSFPRDITPFGDGVAFTAADGTHGRELYVSDGATVHRLGDLRPGAQGSDPKELTVVGSTLFFTVDDGAHGRELWKTDGTAPGTMRVKDIRPGGKGSSPAHLTAFKGKVFFSARDATHGRELWRSDGTGSGTVMVKDIQANGSSLYASGFTRPDRWAVFKGHLYFGVQFDHLGLWRTDGTRNGTRRVYADVYPQGLVATSVRLFFQGITRGCSADDVVFASDGTDAGTHMVADDYGAGTVVVLQGRAYWAQLLSASVTRLFRSSGTWDTTGPVMPIVRVDDVDGIQSTGGALFLSQDGGLTISDGYGVHTYKLGDTGAGFAGRVDVAKLGDLWYFPGGMDGNSHDLWQTNGTPEGTQLASLVAPEGASDLASLVRASGAIWFVANDLVHGFELWRYEP